VPRNSKPRREGDSDGERQTEEGRKPLQKNQWKPCLLLESPLKSQEFGVPELQYISTKRVRTLDEYSNAFVTLIEKRGADCIGGAEIIPQVGVGYCLSDNLRLRNAFKKKQQRVVLQWFECHINFKVQFL
jgi:hypothetical protein